MNFLLLISRRIDHLVTAIGKAIIWLVLAAVLISAANALMRKFFELSSNAFLELQWVLFSAVFLFGAAHALQTNQHIRIDILSAKLSARTRAWIELFGTACFLLPMCGIVVVLSWPVFVTAFQSNEMSANAGGLVLWPARLLVPIGFSLLALQGASQAIKCVAFLRGVGGEPNAKIRP